MNAQKLVIGSDHGGFELKCRLKNHLENKGYDLTDIGCYSAESVDYPEYARLCCARVISNPGSLGILICGSGIGMSISANKFLGIRAALCTSEYHAEMSKRHNDANVLCLGARVTAFEYAAEIARVFLNTGFDGGRHEKRLKAIEDIETNNQRDCI